MDFWSALSGWKRYLLGISAALGIVGVVSQDDSQDKQAVVRAVPVEGHLTEPASGEKVLRARPVEAPEIEGISSSGAALWEDPVMRSYASKIGIGFFFALLAGTLLRLFFRGMLTAILVAAVAVAILVYVGVIEPFWTADSNLYRESSGWLKDRTLALKEMFVNHAPSGFAAAAGLFLGLRK